jgi:hypothetical protein
MPMIPIGDKPIRWLRRNTHLWHLALLWPIWPQGLHSAPRLPFKRHQGVLPQLPLTHLCRLRCLQLRCSSWSDCEAFHRLSPSLSLEHPRDNGCVRTAPMSRTSSSGSAQTRRRVRGRWPVRSHESVLELSANIGLYALIELGRRRGCGIALSY